MLRADPLIALTDKTCKNSTQVQERLDAIEDLLSRLNTLKKGYEDETRLIKAAVSAAAQPMADLSAARQKILAGVDIDDSAVTTEDSHSSSTGQDDSSASLLAPFLNVSMNELNTGHTARQLDKQLSKTLESFVLPKSWFDELDADAVSKLKPVLLKSDDGDGDGEKKKKKKIQTARVSTASYIDALLHNAANRHTDVHQKYECDFVKGKENLMRSILSFQP